MIELEPGEFIIGYLRKHWIRFVFQILPHIIVAVIPLFMFTTGFGARVVSGGAKNFVFFCAIVWLLLWVHVFWRWTLFYLNVWVLTNHRIVSAEQHYFFSRHVSTLELEHIQDITIEMNGVIETVIGYGTIRVQTAGELQEFVIDDAAHPEDYKQKIYEAQRMALEIHGRQGNGHNFT